MTSIFRKRWNKWNPVSTIYGRDQEHDTAYQTRIKLTPKTPWGQLMLHIFWRGDADPDFHDHPWDFVIFPFSDYIEHHLDLYDVVNREIVKRWRWHFRPAEYRHRVVGARWRWRKGISPFVTLVWKFPTRRQWGFWVQAVLGEHNGSYRYIPWRDYVFGKADASK